AHSATPPASSRRNPSSPHIRNVRGCSDSENRVGRQRWDGLRCRYRCQAGKAAGQGHRCEGVGRMQGPHRTFPAWLASLVLSPRPAGPVLADDPDRGPEHAARPVPAAAAGGLTLADLEHMALQGNPTLSQAAAQVEAARGRALQAGLYPNPTVGYEADR